MVASLSLLAQEPERGGTFQVTTDSLLIPLTQELLKVYCSRSLLFISGDTTDYPALCAQTIFS